MLHEFAVEPRLLTNWKDFRYFVEKFGVPHGRLISRYPKKWKRMVFESLAECGEIERKRIEERLARLDDRMMNSSRIYNPERGWLENSETSHGLRPFRAILAKGNPRNQAFVLDGDALDETHPLWKVPRSLVVPRRAADMTACVSLLLQLCDAVILVDPHFRPQERRFTRPLEAFLAAACRPDGAFPAKIEIHLTTDWDHLQFQEKCQQRLPRVIPTGVQICVRVLEERDGGEKLHNRYILTDRGGVKFNIGLDDGDPGQTDDVDLLDELQYQLRWAQYVSGTPAFDCACHFTVRGARLLPVPNP